MVPGESELREDGPAVGLDVQLLFRGQDADGTAGLLERLRGAAEVLSGFPGFLNARLARAIDDPHLVALTISWDQVGSYRRALSAYEVKLAVVPLLSEAIDAPSAFEVLHVRDRVSAVDSVSSLAADAGRVSLGEAAAQWVPPAPS